MFWSPEVTEALVWVLGLLTALGMVLSLLRTRVLTFRMRRDSQDDARAELAFRPLADPEE